VLDDEVLFVRKFNLLALAYEHHFTLDGRPASIRCLWGMWKGDPISIALIVNNVLVALYGSKKALGKNDVPEAIQCHVKSVTRYWGRGIHDTLTCNAASSKNITDI
jgi:hypothetical protein